MQKLVNDVDNDRMQIIHILALSGDQHRADEVVALLVGAGVDINTKSQNTQETPLQFAVIYKRVPMVRALLAHGARVDISDWRGDSPLPRARKNCTHNGKSN